MPRKRKTKLTSRTKPKLPDGGDPSDLSENERREKLELFLHDFDLEVENRIEKMRIEANNMCSAIGSIYKVEMFKLPKDMRNMTRSEFLAKGGSVDAVALEEVSKAVDSLASTAVSTLKKPTNRIPLSSVGNTTSTGPPSAETKSNDSVTEPSIIEITIKEEAASPEIDKKRKRGRPTTAAKGKSKTSSTAGMPPPALATVRRSARKQTQRNAFVTPAIHMGRHNALTAGLDTPAVTPKFDPRLPITPAIMRVPKAGERIMSMAGSPLTNMSHKGAKVAEAYIPLPDGKALQLMADQDLPDVSLSEVNDTTRKNLLLLQEKISKILKQQPAASASQ